jgi:hypothetical protein
VQDIHKEHSIDLNTYDGIDLSAASVGFEGQIWQGLHWKVLQLSPCHIFASALGIKTSC